MLKKEDLDKRIQQRTDYIANAASMWRVSVRYFLSLIMYSTVLGAIGGGMMNEEENFQFVYSVDTKTITASVLAFFNKLIEHSPVPLSQLVICLDNHPVHSSKAVKAFCADRNIELLFLPSYSSTLNPVERCWSMFK